MTKSGSSLSDGLAGSVTHGVRDGRTPVNEARSMRFRILGPVEVQVDGGWSSISATKWRTVLAVLLLRAREVVLTDQLTSEVWPEDAPGPSANLITVYLLPPARPIRASDVQGPVI